MVEVLLFARKVIVPHEREMTARPTHARRAVDPFGA